MSSVALTFFAFLGFGVITFTAKDLADPRRQLPPAVYLALGIATVVYVAVALGVFGTLSVQEVIDSGGTALAVAAEPVLGAAGYWLMTVTALFATAGATNSGLYPAAGLGDEMAAVGQFPPVMSRRVGGRAPMGIVVTAAAAIVLAVFFDLNAIASIGSAVALVVFTLVTFGHYRIRHETGARSWLLILADVTTIVVLVAFAAHHPGRGAGHGRRAGGDPAAQRGAGPALEAPTRGDNPGDARAGRAVSGAWAELTTSDSQPLHVRTKPARGPLSGATRGQCSRRDVESDERLGLQRVELGLRDGSRVQQRLGAGDLVCRRL